MKVYTVIYAYDEYDGTSTSELLTKSGLLNYLKDPEKQDYFKGKLIIEAYNIQDDIIQNLGSAILHHYDYTREECALSVKNCTFRSDFYDVYKQISLSKRLYN